MKYMKGYMGDGMVILTSLFVLVVVLIGLMYSVHLGERKSCYKKSQMMGMQADYGVWTGCMVKVGDRYFPRENIRLVNGEIVVDMQED